MSLTLRALCVIGSALTFWIIVRRVKKASVRIDDSIFWIVFSFALLIVALFPSIPYALSDLLGIQSPSNFVFLTVITILLMREFTNTLKISKLNARLDELVEEQALQAKEADDKSEEQ